MAIVAKADIMVAIAMKIVVSPYSASVKVPCFVKK